jgi:hypothetical protein
MRDSLYPADIIDSTRTGALARERGEQWDDDEILRNAVLHQLSVVGDWPATRWSVGHE